MSDTEKNTFNIEQTRYDLIVNARNFHYENFNKWMTYYYVAVAAIFVGFYSIEESNNRSKLWLLVVGYIVSVLWHLSCKGYYFWVKHWAAQLLKMEESNNYAVYSVFSESVKKNENKLLNPLQSANISTSKVTLLFSFSIAVTWLFLILNDSFVFCINKPVDYLLDIFLSLIVTLIVVLLLGLLLKSDLTKHKMV